MLYLELDTLSFIGASPTLGGSRWMFDRQVNESLQKKLRQSMEKIYCHMHEIHFSLCVSPCELSIDACAR